MRREILIQIIDPPSNVVGTLTSDEEPSMLHPAMCCLFPREFVLRGGTKEQIFEIERHPSISTSTRRYRACGTTDGRLADGVKKIASPGQSPPRRRQWFATRWTWS